MADESSWGHAIRLLTADEAGAGCRMGNFGTGTCGRDPIYLLSWTAPHWRGSVSQFAFAACAVHVAGFAQKHDLRVPRPRSSPAAVVFRRRDDEQQERDLTAHILRELRALRREHAELAERFAGLFQMPSPSQRRLPLGMDAGEHRQRLFGDVRESVAG